MMWLARFLDDTGAAGLLSLALFLVGVGWMFILMVGWLKALAGGEGKE